MRRLRAGVRWGLAPDRRRSARLEVFAERSESAPGQKPEIRTMLRAEARF